MQRFIDVAWSRIIDAWKFVDRVTMEVEAAQAAPGARLLPGVGKPRIRALDIDNSGMVPNVVICTNVLVGY